MVKPPSGKPAVSRPEPATPPTTESKRPLLVGRRREGCVTIWFLGPAAPPVPGPWDVALVTRGT